MKEQLISFETAKLAKEKGFRCDTFNYYTHRGDFHAYQPELFGVKLGYEYINESYYVAPTQSVLQKWLREVHNIHVSDQIGWGEEVWYSFIIFKINDQNFFYDSDDSWNNLEEALEEGLQTALKLI